MVAEDGKQASDESMENTVRKCRKNGQSLEESNIAVVQERPRPHLYFCDFYPQTAWASARKCFLCKYTEISVIPGSKTPCKSKLVFELQKSSCKNSLCAFTKVPVLPFPSPTCVQASEEGLESCPNSGVRLAAFLVWNERVCINLSVFIGISVGPTTGRVSTAALPHQHTIGM